ncbi:MAG: hypothetical protein GY810_22810 [Aureispira sp.]|nr:hypothetical protein [Aureispira sp.]
MLRFRYSIIFLFIICSNYIGAQSDYSFKSPYRAFSEGQIYTALEDQAPIYIAPSTKSMELTKVPVGTILYIEERMDELHTQNNFKTNWYRVSFTQDRQQEGFIWGGHIAMQQEIQRDISFAYGLSKIVYTNRGDYSENVMHLKVVMYRDGILLDQITFPTIGTLYTKTQLSASNNKGIPNIHSILNIALSDAFCGGISANVTVFVHNNNLYYIDLLPNGFGDQRFESKYYIYPEDDQGITNQVILREEAGTISKQQQVKYEYQKETYYQWSDYQLIEIN